MAIEAKMQQSKGYKCNVSSGYEIIRGLGSHSSQFTLGVRFLIALESQKKFDVFKGRWDFSSC